MKFGLIGMHFFLRKHTYFHGIYILLDLKVMLCTRLRVFFHHIKKKKKNVTECIVYIFRAMTL